MEIRRPVGSKTYVSFEMIYFVVAVCEQTPLSTTTCQIRVSECFCRASRIAMDTESDFLSEITVRLVVGVVRVGVTGVGLSEWSDCHWTL